MYRRLFLSVCFCLALAGVKAQVPIGYQFSKIKAEFPPLAPLPPEKTYNLGLPDGMTYLENKAEVQQYWSPYGLILVNKWEKKEPVADYTFKVVTSGMKVISSEIRSKSSQRTITGMEYFRDFTFTFPAKVEVVDNATGKVIKSVELVSDKETFTRVYHRNLFLIDTFDPNYKKEVGFDSLKHVERVTEKTTKVMKKIEGEFASEIFDKMKPALVHLYGKADLRVQFCMLNPKEKGRTDDYSDYDATALKFKKAVELFNANPYDPACIALLREMEKFYSEAAQNASAKFVDYVPGMTYLNLAQIELMLGDLKNADIYYAKSLQAKWPGSKMDLLDQSYLEARKFFDDREKLKD